MKIKGAKHWLWRAIDEYGAVLDVLLQEHRNTEAAKNFFTTLLSRQEAPTTIHTDTLGATARPSVNCLSFTVQSTVR